MWITLLFCMTLFDKKLAFFNAVNYVPGHIQHQIHEALTQYRFVAVRGGVRSGKTVTAGMEQAFHIHEPDASLWTAAPSYDLTDKIFRIAVEKGVKSMGLPLLKDQSRPPYIHTAINSRLWGKSTEELKSLEGEGVTFMTVDEFGYIQRMAWTRLLLRLDQADSRCLVIFTPKGKNQFSREFWAEKEMDKVNWKTIKMPTTECEYVTKEFLENVERELGSKNSPAYKEQILGEFIAYGSLVYADFSQNNIGIMQPTKDWRFIIGADYGWTHPCVADYIAISSQDDIYILAEHHQQFTTRLENARLIIDKAAKIQKETGIQFDIGVSDPSDPEFKSHLKTFGAAIGIHWKDANNDVDKGLELVRQLMPMMKINPACKQTVFNYQNYSHKEGSEDIQKINDDHCDSDRYALMAHFGRSKSEPWVVRS